jgi:hypothetical protein
MASSPSTLFKLEPAPWTCKCTAYVCTFWRSSSHGLPSSVYDPLEASSTFRSFDEDYLGGLCLVQMIRYTSTPVGAYDEFAILPGFFRRKDSREKHARISRIYVSQKDTCYNGRKNWNIPKHMARFKFTNLRKGEHHPLLSSQDHGGPLLVEVFANEAGVTKPFITATFSPTRIPLPYIPFSSTWLRSLAINPPLLQPPLPAGNSAEECGTHEWKRSIAKLSSRKSSMMWCDMSIPQDRVDEGVASFLPADAGKWWAKWLVALKMEDAILEIGEPEIVEEN